MEGTGAKRDIRIKSEAKVCGLQCLMLGFGGKEGMDEARLLVLLLFLRAVKHHFSR